MLRQQAWSNSKNGQGEHFITHGGAFPYTQGGTSALKCILLTTTLGMSSGLTQLSILVQAPLNTSAIIPMVNRLPMGGAQVQGSD